MDKKFQITKDDITLIIEEELNILYNNKNITDLFEKINILYHFILKNINNLEDKIKELFDLLAKVQLEKNIITISKSCDKGVLGFSNNNYHVDQFVYDNYADILADLINFSGQYNVLKEQVDEFDYKCFCNENKILIKPKDHDKLYLQVNHYG